MKALKTGVLICLATLLAPLANATLGQPTDSVQSDREGKGSTSNFRSFSAAADGQQNGFTYKEFTHPSHRVREYYANNQVYAITCSGRVQCDHKKLLGNYAAEFSAELAKSREHHDRGLRAPVQFSSENLQASLVSNGRLFISKIVLKKSAPAAFKIEEMP